ncbi:hypothetical protein GCM10010495_54590 [Kitasatospora herbaricolor]|uniref:hypothetical protein n=1 Tax=Kitasatospora herbaricolor TaxID=68217 RepID=UPI0017499609|nr:hypothetical protein [Kitasatospora herbaricolor]MDQ0307197.1 hypothetical protein [Kitasatospora herbaricolor]GGV31191.1 hypothetical protein GCM10010495_54590 [Kitasatospora herbaricolor]
MSAKRRRLPDEVRSAAVRAVICLACTLVGLIVAVLASYAHSGALTPALTAMGLGVFGTAWCLLEILISRQIAAQRARGPHSASPMAGGRGPAALPPAQPQARTPPVRGHPGAYPYPQAGPSGGVPGPGGRQPRLPTA